MESTLCPKEAASAHQETARDEDDRADHPRRGLDGLLLQNRDHDELLLVGIPRCGPQGAPGPKPTDRCRTLKFQGGETAVGALPGGGCLDGGIRLDAVVELLEAQRLDVVAGVDRDAPQDSERDAEDPVVPAAACGVVRHCTCTVEPFKSSVSFGQGRDSTRLSLGARPFVRFRRGKRNVKEGEVEQFISFCFNSFSFPRNLPTEGVAGRVYSGLA